MNKISTSLNQSKKLIELGIDINTADMYYQYYKSFSPSNGITEGHCAILVIGSWKEHHISIPNADIPAWSLSALLDILAKETHNIDEDGYVVLSSYKGNWWDISPINCISEEIKESNNPLDAAFEMICWLKRKWKDMTREEEINQTSEDYRNFREYCGVKDPVMLNEVEKAYYNGALWADSITWKHADGDNLPEINREVIALIEENGHYKVVFAHRPPEYWDGRNILTNEVTRNYTKRYDKGEWNQPNVKWWLDLELPKMEE